MTTATPIAPPAPRRVRQRTPVSARVVPADSSSVLSEISPTVTSDPASGASLPSSLPKRGDQVVVRTFGDSYYNQTGTIEKQATAKPGDKEPFFNIRFEDGAGWAYPLSSLQVCRH